MILLSPSPPPPPSQLWYAVSSLDQSSTSIRLTCKVSLLCITHSSLFHPPIQHSSHPPIHSLIIFHTTPSIHPPFHHSGVDSMNLSSSISHFLNCFLGSCPYPSTQALNDDVGAGGAGVGGGGRGWWWR